MLFQYAFARGYAEAVGATLETPPWIGQALFGLNDPPLSEPLPSLALNERPCGEVNVDLFGYFQHADCYKYYTLSKLREWFKFRQVWLDQFPRKDDVYVATHVRRGDYTTVYPNIFCTIANEAYDLAIREAGYAAYRRVDVREDSPTEFRLPGFEFMQDFFTIYNAPVVFRANSTFSWWAATLGHAREVYSPVVEGLRGYQKEVKFVKGNWPRCVDMDMVHDYHLAP
jgi:hypothetical protein